MPALDFTAALGRLLSDARLREAFSRDRIAAARGMNLRADDVDAVLALDAKHLDAQASALLMKRMHEAARLLPRTFERLGDAAQHYFSDYAQTYWPRSHLRHLEDAAGFGAYLIQRGVCVVERAEVNRAEFKLRRRRVAVHFVAMDVSGTRRRAIQLLVCGNSGRQRETAIYLGL